MTLKAYRLKVTLDVTAWGEDLETARSNAINCVDLAYVHEGDDYPQTELHSWAASKTGKRETWLDIEDDE